jgi:thiamine-phosphate diphosphorylase
MFNQRKYVLYAAYLFGALTKTALLVMMKTKCGSAGRYKVCRPILQIVTTGRQSLEEVERILYGCSSDVVDMIQIREKNRTAKELLEWCEIIRLRMAHSTIIINDRVDVALAAGAGGVQLAYHSLPLPSVRRIIPSNRLIGCSVHSVEEAAAAAREGADYVLYGHVYSTSSKEGLPPRGIAALKKVVEAAAVPVIAIGGITPSNVHEVLSTGCAGIAVMSSVLLDPAPQRQIAAFREQMDRSRYEINHILSLDKPLK